MSCNSGNPSANTAIDYKELGKQRSKNGDNQGAIKCYTKAIEIDSLYVDAYYNRAIVKDRIGDKKGAIADYSTVINLQPHDGEAYLNRGVLMYEMGDTEGEIADYRKALDIAKETGDVGLGVDVSNNLGRTLYDLKRFKEAVEAYTIGIELAPDDYRLYYGRGLARNQSDDKKGACEDWRKSSALGCFEANALLPLCADCD